MSRRVLFNTSNLHTGGAVQVATSVINEWAMLNSMPAGLDIWASTEVDANLRAVGCNVSGLAGYRVVDTYGVATLFSSKLKVLQEFEQVFTLFGPLYAWNMKPYSIVGFAQAWILYPNNDASRQAPFIKRSLSRLKFLMQELFFRRADRLVVELEHVAEQLAVRRIAPKGHVEVIHNCIGSIYLQPERWTSVNVVPITNCINIGFVGRNYSHKNTAILPAVTEALLRYHNMVVKFFVTFNEAEWSASSENFRNTVSNVGPLTVAQCPTFYQMMDGVIFPSLLECFSATPLEALAMGKPLFASDRSFNRDICDNYAIYFDPLVPEDAARQIAIYFNDPSDRSGQREAARQFALAFSNAETRARKYLDVLISTSHEVR